MKRWMAAIGFVLAACAIARAQGSAQDKIYSRQKAFKIPFQIPDPSEQKQIKEVQLYVARNGGKWEKYTSSLPDAATRTFTFRTDQDGEFWFAVRTMDSRGTLNPESDANMSVGLRVVVDSEVPKIELRPLTRAGREVGVEWEVNDRNLDLDTLRLEYRVDGQELWQPVPGVIAKFVGQATWTSEVAGRVSVRCQVEDKAHNLGIQSISLDSSGSSRGSFAAPSPFTQNQPNTQPFTADSGVGLRPFNRQPEIPAGAEPAAASLSNPGRNTPPALQNDAGRNIFNRAPATEQRPVAPFGERIGDESTNPATQTPNRTPPFGSRTAPPAAPAQPKPANRQIVNDSEVSLDYQIEDEGPSGVSVIELWITTDAGRTWKRIGDDPDRVSPFTVNLAGEGLYGLTMVAKSGVGLGDRPPVAGDQPQMWVEVDKTPPRVQLDTPEIGKGPQAGSVIINWQADDANLGDRCVSLYYTESGKNDWRPITAGVENSGRYVWKMGSQVPFRFRVAIEISDMAGNREMQESAEVTIDMSKPKPKMIGVKTGGNYRQ